MCLSMNEKRERERKIYFNILYRQLSLLTYIYTHASSFRTYNAIKREREGNIKIYSFINLLL
jgi:hypothetical protein